jgi:hypothetical protein
MLIKIHLSKSEMKDINDGNAVFREMDWKDLPQIVISIDKKL